MKNLSTSPDINLTISPVENFIPPPPEKVYQSEAKAFAAIHEWTREHHYNLTKRRAFYSDEAKTAVWKRGLDCDRSGGPKETQQLACEDRVRTMRGSKRMGCKMKLVVRAVSKDDPHGPWEIVHTRNGGGIHNHPASEDTRVHACHRQRAAVALTFSTTDSIQTLVEAQTAAGVSVASIRATLNQADPGSFVTPKDIANTKNAVRRREMATQTVMEALFSSLEKQGFFFRHATNPATQELRYLFWAHPATAAVYRRHNDVLVMDCTYKTNKYKLPLLNIIAVTGFNTALPVAQCWLPGEKEEDYVWGLNMLRIFMIELDVGLPSVILTDRELACMNAADRVFPGVPAMVCRWHMNKNVEAIARKTLGQVSVVDPITGLKRKENTWVTDAFMAAFYSAVEALTETEFSKRCDEIKKNNLYLSAYLDTNWWKYKERIVKAWTNVRDTSIVEGTHAKCKTWLRSSRGDLYTVYKSLLPWWQGAASDTQLLSARKAVITPFVLQPSRYAAVVRVISVYALTATESLWQDASKIVHNHVQQSLCSGSFRSVNGRPCLHDLIAIIKSNGQLRLQSADFAKHWWINRYVNPQMFSRVLEPANVSTASRAITRNTPHRLNAGVNGTRREPTFSERVDQNHPATPPLSSWKGYADVVALPATATTRSAGVYQNVAFEEAFVPPRSWGYAGENGYT